jgi:hypothetical protein
MRMTTFGVRGDVTAGQSGEDGVDDDDHPVTNKMRVFYYPWYASPAVNGKWLQWAVASHILLPHSASVVHTSRSLRQQPFPSWYTP